MNKIIKNKSKSTPMAKTPRVQATSDRQAEKSVQTEWYDPINESLIFDDGDIILYVNQWRRINLAGGVKIRHFGRRSPNPNRFQDKFEYLHFVFKQYLNRAVPEPLLEVNRKRAKQQQRHMGRNRTSFLAQFHPYLERLEINEDDLPTYIVSYDVEMSKEQKNNHVIQISFRQITSQSYLTNALDCFCRPVLDPSVRNCVVIEYKTNMRKANSSAENNLKQKNNNNDELMMRACTMAINPQEKMVDKRLFLVAKQGWLAVYLKHYSDAFLLLENEYLIFPEQLRQVPIFYERILNINQAVQGSELFYRRTSLDHDVDSCSGMIVCRGVIHNQFTPDSFKLIGFGNAIVNFSYFQQLLTISDNDDDERKSLKSN